jgi:hypothetical protein
MEDIRAAYRNLRRNIRIANLRGGSLVELHARDRIRSRRSLFIILTPYVVPRGDASTNPLRRLTRVYYNGRHISGGCPLREQERWRLQYAPNFLISSQIPSAPSRWYR